MFKIEFRSWFTSPNPSWDGTEYDTLQGAKEARVCSGDLVVHSTTGKIVSDPLWFFEWEKIDPTCYAQKAIEWQERMNSLPILPVSKG